MDVTYPVKLHGILINFRNGGSYSVVSAKLICTHEFNITYSIYYMNYSTLTRTTIIKMLRDLGLDK